MLTVIKTQGILNFIKFLYLKLNYSQRGRKLKKTPFNNRHGLILTFAPVSVIDSTGCCLATLNEN